MFGANGLIGYTDMPQMKGDAILIIKDGSGVGTASYAQGEFSVIGTLNYLTAINNYDLRYLYFVLSVFNFSRTKQEWQYHISTSRIMVMRKYIVLHFPNKSVLQMYLENWRANSVWSKIFLHHSIYKSGIYWGGCLYKQLLQ